MITDFNNVEMIASPKLQKPLVSNSCIFDESNIDYQMIWKMLVKMGIRIIEV